MMKHFSIKTHEVHLWRVHLADFFSEEEQWAASLSPDEKERAARFHFAIHRQRFVIARALLRQVLSLYLDCLPKQIIFSYGAHQKPFVADTTLHFNVSHSDDVAIYALTMQQEIGVDIEKSELTYNDDLAKRFFSAEEYVLLHQAPDAERANTFYKLWARKEALIKAVGQGLFMPLDAFSVDQMQITLPQHTFVNSHPSSALSGTFSHKGRTVEKVYLQDFFAFPGFQSAVATFFPIENDQHWQWGLQGPVLLA